MPRALEKRRFYDQNTFWKGQARENGILSKTISEKMRVLGLEFNMKFMLTFDNPA